jgi:RimJ/RimL family protein N-acetyltransferase
MSAKPDFDWPALRLTPLEAGDAEPLNRWQNDQGIRDIIMGFRGPVQMETTAQWIESMRATNLKDRVVFAIRRDGVLKGVVQLHTIDWVHRKAILGVYVGDPGERGSGLGRAASSLILDYGFNGLDLERIWLEVIAPNTAAKHLYEQLGFVREGVLRSAYVLNGERVDIEHWGMLKAEHRSTLPPQANRLVHAP